MNQFYQVINQISKDQQYQQQLQTLDLLIKNQKNAPDKQSIKIMLDAINTIITQSKYSNKTKFYALNIIKDFSLKKYSQFLTALSSSKIFQTMIKLAKTVDPKNKMEDKGKTYFSDSALGNKFITLVLQCIANWGQKYPQNSQKKATKFKIALTQLQQSSVVLPKTYIYFKSDQNKNKKSTKPQVSKEQTPGGPSNNQKLNLKSVQNNLKFSLNKIQGFYQVLAQMEGDQEIQKTQIQISKYHTTFQKQQLNLEKLTQKIFQTQILDEEWTTIIINLGEFYQLEAITYQKYIIQNKDVKSYIQNVKNDGKIIEAYFTNKISRKSIQNNQSKVSKEKASQPIKKQPQKIQNQQIQKKNSGTNNSKVENSKIKKQDNKVDYQPQMSFGIIKQMQRQNQAKENQIKKFLAKTTSVGFGAIKQQLQRQKSMTRPVGGTRKKSTSPISQYKPRSVKSSNFNQSINQSKVSIFQLHNDIKVTRTNYSGTYVQKTIDFGYQIQDLNKQGQGIRRFKIANFKDKGLLYENDHLQIGYKSSPIYQNLQNFQIFLKFTLYFGNKSDVTIERVRIDYEGDKTNLLYCNPIELQSSIEPGLQAKQQLIIIPMDSPFNFINFKISYLFRKSMNRYNIFIPNSILKFTQFQRLDVNYFKRQYKNTKRNGNLFRTVPFKLSKNLPPTTLKKYLSSLTQLNDYQQFLAQKEYMQYKLIGSLIVVDNEQYLLKIRIRPDMTVVLQLGALNPDEDTIKYGKFVLQTLQFLLEKQNDN